PSFHIWFQPLASRVLTLADVLPARPLRVIDGQDARQDASPLVPGASSVSRSGLRLRPTWRKCHVVVSNACIHISAVSEVKHPVRPECSECVKIGGQWVHLRTCQE